MKLLRLSCLSLLLGLSSTASAQLNGYHVVLVHGFNAYDLRNQPNQPTVSANGAQYWSEYWHQHADTRIDWPSHERIEGKISTDYLWPALQKLSLNNSCQQGCLFITHSTGDLVTRYLIDNQANWLENAGLTPLNIVATLDFAGAGGGSELADTVVNNIEANGLTGSAIRRMAKSWLGFEPKSHQLGVLHDLVVNTARQLAPQPDDSVPRLRFSANSTEYFGLTGPFLTGSNDGVVSAHSSCGSQRVRRYNSCSRELAFDGKIARSKGVRNNQLMSYHFPVIMGDDYTHSTVISAKREGPLAPVNQSVTLNLGGRFSFESYTKESGWFWTSTYRYVSGSEYQSLSDTVVSIIQ